MAGSGLMLNSRAMIEDLDFNFENKLVNVVAMRNCPKIEVGGMIIGPFEEGQEYEVRFWVANELEKAGMARLRDEDLLDAQRLYKIQWTERVQSVLQITALLDDFYPKLRRCIKNLKKGALKDPEKMREYERVTRWAQDILNCRMKKIVSLSSSSRLNNQFMGNLTKEELWLYEQLHKIMEEWKASMLKVENEE